MSESYESDILLELDQYPPDLARVAEPDTLYNELLDIHNALELIVSELNQLKIALAQHEDGHV